MEKKQCFHKNYDYILEESYRFCLGTIAGISGCAAVFPIDTMKSKLQYQKLRVIIFNTKYLTFNFLTRIFKTNIFNNATKKCIKNIGAIKLVLKIFDIVFKP